MPRPAGSRRSHASLRLVAVLVVLVVTIVALASFVSSRMRGAAADPGALAAKFSAAGITCRSLDVIFDTRSSKALGCAGTDGHIITITTYGARPSAADWQRARCNAAAQPRDGAYVAGDGFIIDIRQGPYPSELLGEPASPIDAARRLVTVLGGAAATYACP
ncbi:MAG TPA: hypothetical protein VHN98_10675 [Acidimicrobiales bacterium]|nr:hypothetical protein [Acidimicrobiales bacterium]